MIVARSFGEARQLLSADASAFQCVLVDLSLPDADGLDMLREVLGLAPRAAVLVLTGLNDAQVGVAAVAAGAEDYLVKQEVDAPLLARAVRYAIERKRADESERELAEAHILSRENARLARGLLPVPQLRDTTLRHHIPPIAGHADIVRKMIGGPNHDLLDTEEWNRYIVLLIVQRRARIRVPSICTTRPSLTKTSCPQPTAQYGHTDLTIASAVLTRGRSLRYAGFWWPHHVPTGRPR